MVGRVAEVWIVGEMTMELKPFRPGIAWETEIAGEMTMELKPFHPQIAGEVTMELKPFHLDIAGETTMESMELELKQFHPGNRGENDDGSKALAGGRGMQEQMVEAGRDLRAGGGDSW